MGLFSGNLTFPTAAVPHHDVSEILCSPQMLCAGSLGFSFIISFILLLTAISLAMVGMRPHPRAPGIESVRQRNESCFVYHQPRAEEGKSMDVNWALKTNVGGG
jgi:hypothetical protein